MRRILRICLKTNPFCHLFPESQIAYRIWRGTTIDTSSDASCEVPWNDLEEYSEGGETAQNCSVLFFAFFNVRDFQGFHATQSQTQKLATFLHPYHAGNLAPGIMTAPSAFQPNAHIIPYRPCSRQERAAQVARQQHLLFVVSLTKRRVVVEYRHEHTDTQRMHLGSRRQTAHVPRARAPQVRGHNNHRAVHGHKRRRGLFGHGNVREGEAGLAAAVPSAAQRHTRRGHVPPGVRGRGSARTGRVPEEMAGGRTRGPGRRRGGRQDHARLGLRQTRGVPCRQRVRGGEPARPAGVFAAYGCQMDGPASALEFAERRRVGRLDRVGARPDASRARKDNSPLNMNILRKTALMCLNQAKYGRVSKKKMMYKATLNLEVLLDVLFLRKK